LAKTDCEKNEISYSVTGTVKRLSKKVVVQFEFPEPCLRERFLASARNDIDKRELSSRTLGGSQDELRERSFLNASLAAKKGAPHPIKFLNA
jgi:hypothetical protein